MALKEEPYALPLKLAGQPFAKASPCGANSCILASYAETPSIAWISTSPLVVDGVVCVLPKFTGWTQKSHLRAEWPFAVSIWKRPGTAKNLALFVYHLAEAAYYVFKISADAQVALMMGYERAVVVLKDSLVVYNLFDPTRNPVTIATQTIPQLLPSLCSATSDSLILTSYNTIQQWTVNPKTAQARVDFKSHAEGFGFCEVVAYDETIAAVSEGGHKLHLYDTYSPDPTERIEDNEVTISSPIPITKVFIDEEFIITGLADGTMKLYDRELRTFLSQLNVIPVAARGLEPGAGDGHTTAAPAYLQHKISFLARYDELVIASMLDPSHNEKSSSAPQLEISIWPIRGQNVVQPLKTKLLPGNVNFVHFEDRNALLMALTQHDLSEPDSPKFAPTSLSNNFANRGPLVLLSWHPPFKSLMASGIKWRETNTQQQAKLASEVMEKVLLEPSFFRAMFNVEADQEEIDQIVESMFISLSGKDSLQGTFIDTSIAQEVIIRRTNGIPSASSAPSLSQSTPETEKSDSASSKAPSNMSHSTSSIPKDLADRSNTSANAPATPPQYFPPNAMTTAVISKCLSELSSNYMSYVLNKPLAILLKSPVSNMMFSLPSTHASVEEQPMISNLIRVTSGIIDGLIENQSKFTIGLQRMLSSVHQAVCAENYPDSELKSFRRGVARVFLDYVILKPWLEPVEAGFVHKLTDEARHNLRVVAQLMQVIAGYSKHKLSDPGLCSLVTEYSTKWRSWLLSKVSESQGDRDGTPKSKEKRSKNMARGASFVAQKSGNNKTAALVVTKFIITHVQELLAVMTRFEGRTPDPTATKIRAISDSLMMPIMSMMAKKGTKNSHLAASLRVFGRSGSMPSGSTNSSGSSHTHSSSESVSSESVGGPRDDTATSEGKTGGAPADPSSAPTRRKKPKRKSSTASAPQSIDSGSSEGRIPSATSSDAGNIEIRSDGSTSIALRKSPRPKKQKARTINKKISSGSLTASSVEEEKDEDLSDSSDDTLPPRAQSVDAIRVVGEVDVSVPSVPPSSSDHLSASSSDVKTPKERRKRKSRPGGLPVIHDVPSH